MKFAAVLILVLTASDLVAQLPQPPLATGDAAADSTARQAAAAVHLFDAIDRDLVSVRYIALSSAKGNLLVNNLSDEAVWLRLPDAFAARPVTGQFGGPMVGAQQGMQNGGGQNGGAAQAVGGNANAAGNGNGLGNPMGFGAGGGNNGGFDPGGFNPGGFNAGGFMRIPPRRTIRRSVTTVCLQYGLRDPSPSMRYEIVPIESVTEDELLRELCRDVGGPTLSPSAGQAAAWHHADGLSWDELSKLDATRSRYRGNTRRFAADAIDAAMDWTHAALSRVNGHDRYNPSLATTD